MTTKASTPAGLEPFAGRDLRSDGIDAAQVFWNPGVAPLYEEAIRRGEGVIAAEGPLVCRTGIHTGRSPNDKFIVRVGDATTRVAWGKVNRALDPEQFDRLAHA